MTIDTPAGTINQITPIREFVELTTITNAQYLLGIQNISTGNGSKITFGNLITSLISGDANNKLVKGSDDKLFISTPIEIGTLANLTTSNKTNLVSAINELNLNMGSLSNLETTVKTSLVAAINSVAELIEPELLIDKVNQSKALITGNVAAYQEELEQIKLMKRSTFDRSKFTKVGNPTITTDGVSSNFSTGNYISFAAGLQNYNTFDIVCGTIKTLNDGRFFITSSLSVNAQNDSGFQISINLSGNSRWFAGTGNGWDIAYQKIGSITYAVNDLVTFRLSFNGTRYTLYSSVNGGVWQVDSYVDSTLKINTPTLYLGYFPIATAVFASTIDLKDVSVTLDGVPTFAGNQTGIDTYTINSSTVTVPYTLSKTGSKIVDSYYRTQVQSVYNEFGYAPYYTLSNTDFTLPMGELYGLYEKYALKTLNGVTLDYSSLLSQTSSWGTDITAPDNGYVFAQDNIAQNANITAKVNNVTLYTSSTGGSIGYTIPIIIPVSKGDIYNISGGANAARALNFIPMKGV